MDEKLTEVQLKKGRYKLKKENSNSGDSGPRWTVYDYEATMEKGDYVWLADSAGLVKVGCGIRVGALTARSFHNQDWWQCSPVTEILEVNDDKTRVRFKTSNSIYVAESF